MVKKPHKVAKEISPKKVADTRHSVREAAPLRGAGPKMKPAVIVVGADKGGVGKTTIARAILDYLALNNVFARAFDTETPRGTLHRFHPDETSVVDLTSASDQMRVIDTLNSSDAKVSVIDVRAGGLGPALQALDEIAFFDAVKAGEYTFILLHVLGSSIASLEEIAEIAPYIDGAHYFLVKNHVNDTTFFEWDPVTHRKYFEQVNMPGEITIPKLNEMAYEQVELAGTPFSTFIANETAAGKPAEHSFVLRGYVRTWLSRVADEFDRVGLIDLIAGKSGKAR
jgi:hypothetical protein